MAVLTGILVGLLFIVVVAYLWHIRKAYDFFVQLNIPGPPPTLFFGNFLEIFKSNGQSFAIKKWTDKYGHIFGYFEGHTPVLVVSDPDVLEDILVKSFSKFHSRREVLMLDSRAKNTGLSRAVGPRWKRQRLVLNPTFSSAKLKQMSSLIHRSIEALMTKMADQCGTGESFDIYAYFKRFTMDTIWSCGFGLDTDMQNNINDPFLLNSQKVFTPTKIRRVLFNLIFSITELKQVFRRIFQLVGIIQYSIRRYIPVAKWVVAESPITWIMKQANEMIEKRKQIGHTHRTDLLQLMLASVSDEDFIEVRFSL
jgi:cytochrome P450